MKKSTKLISLLMAVMMVVALLPTMALADDVDANDIGDTVGGVVDIVNGIEIPSYLVYCSLMSKMPASHAIVTLTNNLTGEASAYTANALGLALIPKSIIGVYTVAATCDGALTGLKYSTIALGAGVELRAPSAGDGNIVHSSVTSVSSSWTSFFCLSSI